METLELLKSTSHVFFYENADPRVRDKFLMGSPLPLLIICFGFVIMVKYGKKFMKNRKALNTRTALDLSNVSVLLIEIYLFCRSLEFAIRTNYNLKCEPLNRSKSGTGLEVTEILYLFYITRLFLIVEAVILIVGKKNHRVTSFYMAHHISLFMSNWFVVNYAPGGHLTLFLIVCPGSVDFSSLVN
jgi:hypothetical protein